MKKQKKKKERKDPDAGKDWGQEEKGMTEDEMVGWHHRLNWHEFGWTPGVGDGQGGLACYSSWSQNQMGHVPCFWQNTRLWQDPKKLHMPGMSGLWRL